MVRTAQVTKLKIALLNEDVPQYMVAAKCEMHPSILSMYALGQRPIKRVHLHALTRYFNCRQSDLIGWEEIDY
jgi:hypothetical protein